MRRVVGLVIALAACGRVGFDAPVDGGGDAAIDAPPSGSVACGGVAVLGPATSPAPHLSVAAVGADRLIATYLDDAGAVAWAVVRIAGGVATLERRGTIPTSATQTAVAVEGTVAAIADLGASGQPMTELAYLDVDTGALLPASGGKTTVLLSTAHGVASLGDGASFALIGDDGNGTTRGALVDVAGDISIMGLAIGTGDTRVSVTPYANGRLLVVRGDGAGTCRAREVDATLAAQGASVTWSSGTCDQPVGAVADARGKMLFVRHDTTDGDLNHVVGTSSGTALTIPGVSRLVSPASEGRPIPDAIGFWATYASAGTLGAKHVLDDVSVDATLDLGALGDPTGHDAVVVGGVPYAVRAGTTLDVMQLCR